MTRGAKMSDKKKQEWKIKMSSQKKKKAMRQRQAKKGKLGDLRAENTQGGGGRERN